MITERQKLFDSFTDGSPAEWMYLHRQRMCRNHGRGADSLRGSTPRFTAHVRHRNKRIVMSYNYYHASAPDEGGFGDLF